MGLRKPPIWFLEGSSTLTPYNVSLIFLVNHYCADPSRTRFKLGLTLLECIKHRNLSANQLIGLLGLLGDPELEAEFLDYLQYVLDAHMSIVFLKELLGRTGSAYRLMHSPEHIKTTSPFGLFIRHMIVSFEIASFEQLSTFLADFKRYIEEKDTVYPLVSTKQQEAHFCRLVAEFEQKLCIRHSNREIKELCSSQNEGSIQQAEFLQYLNYLSVKEYNLAHKHLHRYFTMMLNSGDETKNIRPYSALSLAALHSLFKQKDLAVQYLKEAIHLGQLLGEQACLSHCIAWISYLQGSPITRPSLSLDSDAVPDKLELLGHGHALERMCVEGNEPGSVLEHMSLIAPVLPLQQYHTNAARIFSWYGNSLLKELHPFFSLIQLCPSWRHNSHLITFSSDATSLCAALCDLASSLAHTTAPPAAASDLLAFADSLFPPFSEHRELILVTKQKLAVERKLKSERDFRSEAALLRVLSPSTHTALISTEDENSSVCDEYITTQELRARTLYNSAKADLPHAPSQAVEKLLTLVLHCRTCHLQRELVRAQLLLARTQIVLCLYMQALVTVEKALVLALASSEVLVQAEARWLYVQARLATCAQRERSAVFGKVERHLQLALEVFVAQEQKKGVCEVLYFLARLYHEVGMKDDRNKCAKKFKNYNQNLSIHEPS